MSTCNCERCAPKLAELIETMADNGIDTSLILRAAELSGKTAWAFIGETLENAAAKVIEVKAVA